MSEISMDYAHYQTNEPYYNEFQKKSETQDSQTSQGNNNISESYSQLNKMQNQKQSEQQIVPIKKKIHKEENQNQKLNTGHWTLEEHQTYVEFLEQHHSTTMQSQQNRKNNKIFKLMSQTIGTRSPSQCRSHHQKFNPFTSAGQKRIKKNKKKQNTEIQISMPHSIEIKQFYTPEVKPNQDYLYQYECELNQNLFEPEKIRIRRYSLDCQDDSYNFNNAQQNNHFFNELFEGI